MPAYRIRATIPDDRRIVIQLPSESPTGEAAVVVRVPPEERESEPPKRSMREFLEPIRENPVGTLSHEEVEARIHELRDSWD